MKTMMRFASAALVAVLFAGCEAEKPAAPAAGAPGTTPAAELPITKAAKNAKTAAPTNTPSNKPID